MNITYYSSRSTPLSLDTCTGSNNKRILILSNSADLPAQRTFLAKILAAINVDLEADTHLLSVDPAARFSLTVVPGIDAYSSCLTFGLTPDQIGLSHSASQDGTQVYPFEKLLVLCSSPALNQIAGRPELKKDLWEALKAHFKKS